MIQKKKKVEKMIRLSTRVLPAQFAFLKKHAKRLKFTEGETLRSILQEFIDDTKN